MGLDCGWDGHVKSMTLYHAELTGTLPPLVREAVGRSAHVRWGRQGASHPRKALLPPRASILAPGSSSCAV